MTGTKKKFTPAEKRAGNEFRNEVSIFPFWFYWQNHAMLSVLKILFCFVSLMTLMKIYLMLRVCIVCFCVCVFPASYSPVLKKMYLKVVVSWAISICHSATWLLFECPLDQHQCVCLPRVENEFSFQNPSWIWVCCSHWRKSQWEAAGVCHPPRGVFEMGALWRLCCAACSPSQQSRSCRV